MLGTVTSRSVVFCIILLCCVYTLFTSILFGLDVRGWSSSNRVGTSLTSTDTVFGAKPDYSNSSKTGQHQRPTIPSKHNGNNINYDKVLNDPSTQTNPYSTNISVFYNVFVMNKEDVPRVRNIITEQLSYLNQSHHEEVFVHSIGVPMNISNTTLLSQISSGDESTTLHSLWNYCLNHNEKWVVYLHTKGSFHQSPTQARLRKFLTKSALSSECASIVGNNNKFALSCNICSGRFSPDPHPHTSGNMWLASCDYVKNLIDPYNFETKMEGVYHKGAPGGLYTHCIGKDRFSMEHWVYSHPSVKPCDLYPDLGFLWNYDGLPDDINNVKWDLQVAPRFNISTLKNIYTTTGRGKALASICGYIQTGEDRISEYQYLYNQTVSNDWWGWRFYEAKHAQE